MSEKFFRWLLHLYPLRFRQEYGEEALQLFRDRSRDETGVWAKVRLWVDLLADLLVSLPREYRRPEASGTSAKICLDGTPTFFVFDTASPGRRPLLLGGLLSLITLISFPKLMHEVSNFKTHKEWVHASAATHQRRTSDPQRLASGSDRGVPGSRSISSSLDATARHRIIASAIASLKQHHIDALEAQKAADALFAHERQGDDDSATSTEEFTRLATKQMREATGDSQLELLYSLRAIPERTPGPPAATSAAYRNEALRVNCGFERVQILSHNVGYLKLNAFADTSVCQITAITAMAKVNDADALIFDLRDNRGGFPNMVSLIAAYLFDHPEYMYCPLENTTTESWTHSPVPGNKLANKPVYILTSARTISGAEQFTYDLKMLKRATLVGETTAGANHAANLHAIGDNFYIATVEVQAINPYSTHNWNGTGIEPDVKVSADQALKVALTLVGEKIPVK
jgi:hypothetical protein